MITTSELVRQVRAQIQEANEKGPITDEVILDALNRGLDYGWDILARNYKSPILKQSGEVLTDSEGRYVLPEDMFEDRILKVEYISSSGSHLPLEARSPQDVSYLQSDTYGGDPIAYILEGRTLQILPNRSAGNRRIKFWYLEEVPKIVPIQARVTSFTSGGGVSNATIVVDSTADVTLSPSDHFGKYLNFINFETGEIRGSAQIQSVDGNQFTLKLVPTRSEVLGRTISNDIPSTLEVDDYVCGIEGSCVLYFSKPLSNMVIQYAVAEIRRSLGYDVGIEERKLDQLENQVSYTFSKRPNTLRVNRRKSRWRSWFNFRTGGR